MRTLLRVALIALIVLGLASRVMRAHRGEAGPDQREALIGGLDRLHIQSTEVAGSKLLMARSALCDEAFVVGLMRNDGAEDEMTRRFSDSDIVARYVYLGSVAERPSRIASVARWGWATLLFNVGLRPNKPPADMAMVAFPARCAGLRDVDWAALSPWR
jgi:hypothetical protein